MRSIIVVVILQLSLSALVAQSCPTDFSIGNDTSICPGASLLLLSTGLSSAPLEQQWAAAANQVVNPDGSATVSPLTPTLYQLTARVLVGPELVVNGDFSAGDAGFTSDYDYGNSTGGNGPLDDEGQYRVTNNPQSVHQNFASCGDNSTGNGNMLVLNAATAPENLWCQTIPVSPNETYAFQAFATSVVANNPGILQFRINGILLGEPYALSSLLCTWDRFFEFWESGSSTNAEICISNQNLIDDGNDFALDDIGFQRTCLVSDSVLVTPFQPASPELNVPPAICNDAAPSTLNQLLAPTTPSGGEWTVDGQVVNGNFDITGLTLGEHQLNYTIGLADCPVSSSANLTINAATSAGFFNGEELNLCELPVEGFDLRALLIGADAGGTWSLAGDPDFSIDPDSGLLTATPNTTGQGTITYSVIGQGSCASNNAALNFSVENPYPYLLSGTADTLDCLTDSILLSVNDPLGAASNWQYNWFANGEQIAEGTTAITVGERGTYRLFVHNEITECSTDFSLDIADTRTFATLEVQIDSARCQIDNIPTGAVAVTAFPGGNQPFTYQLDDRPFGLDSLITGVVPGNHSVTVMDVNGCSSSMTFTLGDPTNFIFQLTPNGELAVEYGDAVAVGIQTNLPGYLLDSLVWIFGNQQIIGVQRLVAASDSALLYTANLVTDAGCFFTDSLRLRPTFDQLIYAPTAFSPNGDGINDGWVAFFHPAVIAVAQINIFDRWGNQIYSRDSWTINAVDEGWNGTYRGKPLKNGVYVYGLEVELFNGQKRSFSGSITLLR